LKVTETSHFAPGASEVPQLFAEIENSEAFVLVREIFEKVTVLDPVFVRVVVWADEVTPSFVGPQVNRSCETVTFTTCAVPESAAVCGLLLSVSYTVSMAVRLPPAEGRKTTLMLQLAPAPRLFPQVLLLTAKSLAFVPLTPMLEMVIEVEPALLSTVVCAALV
jgi:hypothetical protein